MRYSALHATLCTEHLRGTPSLAHLSHIVLHVICSITSLATAILDGHGISGVQLRSGAASVNRPIGSIAKSFISTNNLVHLADKFDV